MNQKNFLFSPFRFLWFSEFPRAVLLEEEAPRPPAIGRSESCVTNFFPFSVCMRARERAGETERETPFRHWLRQLFGRVSVELQSGIAESRKLEDLWWHQVGGWRGTLWMRGSV